MPKSKIKLADIDLFVFDFDGVLTDNFVYISEDGKESVRCSRSDGLAFDVLRKLKKSTYILSTEKNDVVSSRAEKLRVPIIYGVDSKKEILKSLAKTEGYKLENILYIGNDLNDYHAMKLCGFRVCPADSHIKIKQISTLVLNSNGGFGAIRELLEEVLDLDFTEILY